MKYSFVMPYFRRYFSLYYTLLSLHKWYGKRNDYEIIIGVDSGNNEIEKKELRMVCDRFKDLNIIIFESLYSFQSNPARIRNEAFVVSSGEYIINTNPECFHEVDVLSGFDAETKANPSGYVVCSCKSSFVDGVVTKYEDLSASRFNMWYQHSIENNRLLHWCTCIHRNEYRKIGGFDNAYGDWCGYDDDDFREKIIKNGNKIVVRDDLCVVHVEHDRSNQNSGEKIQAALNYYNKKWNKAVTA